MSILEGAKKIAETVTRLGRPSKDDLANAVRERKPTAYRFGEGGIIPNHPRWPLIVYRGAVRFERQLDPAAVFEDLFAKNGWGDSWRNGIYDYVHYHSRIHEVLGVARGTAKVRLGGDHGRTLTLKAGDVAILPAGTGHQALSASRDFLVVGAYPPFGKYDECTTADDLKRAEKTIPKVGRPRKDPVYGTTGPLLTAWKAMSARSAAARRSA
jgi:uncharacterized protein YjlB